MDKQPSFNQAVWSHVWSDFWAGLRVGPRVVIDLVIPFCVNAALAAKYTDPQSIAEFLLVGGLTLLGTLALGALLHFVWSWATAPRAIYAEQQEQLALLAADRSPTHSAIREGVAKFISEASGLRVLCKTRKADEVSGPVQDWIERCSRYLTDNLDGSFAVRFRDFTGLIRYSEKLADPASSIWFEQVHFGVMRLTEFLSNPLPATAGNAVREDGLRGDLLKARLTISNLEKQLQIRGQQVALLNQRREIQASGQADEDRQAVARVRTELMRHADDAPLDTPHSVLGAMEWVRTAQALIVTMLTEECGRRFDVAGQGMTPVFLKRSVASLRAIAAKLTSADLRR